MTELGPATSSPRGDAKDPGLRRTPPPVAGRQLKRPPAAALATALRWRWLLAVEVALALALGVALYAESLPARFQATSVVAFTPSESVGADEVRLLLPRYPVLLASLGTYQQVSSQTGIPVEELRSGVRITTPADTANVQISVTAVSPGRAAAAANVLAGIAESASADDPFLRGEVVVPAIADRSAAGPSRRLIEAAGVVVALLAGPVAAVVAEQARPRLWSLADVRRQSAVPVIGRLPRHASVSLPPSEALLDRVTGARIRSVRAELAQRKALDGRARVLLITSASRGQGTSTVAMLLAVSFSNIDRRALLVDGDPEEPAVAGRLGVDAVPDQDGGLRDGAVLGRIAVPVSPSLCVLPLVADDHGGDLLARRMPALLEEGRSSFSVILVDGAPVLEGDAGATLAPLADGAVLVVRHGSLASETDEALGLLHRLGVPVLGLVLNGYPERRGDAGVRRSRRPAPPVVQMRGRGERATTA